jgi:hypothetical protein
VFGLRKALGVNGHAASAVSLCSEWETLRSALEDVRQSLTGQRDCGETASLLGTLERAHLALHRLEHALQSMHLACCVFPHVQTPAEVAVALADLSARQTDRGASASMMSRRWAPRRGFSTWGLIRAVFRSR